MVCVRQEDIMLTLCEVVLEEGFGGHVMGEAGGEVLQDALHGVARLLAGDAQVFLQGPRHGREDGLRRLHRVHRDARAWGTREK
jgi:hypothetical protein